MPGTTRHDDSDDRLQRLRAVIHADVFTPGIKAALADLGARVLCVRDRDLEDEAIIESADVVLWPSRSAPPPHDPARSLLRPTVWLAVSEGPIAPDDVRSLRERGYAGTISVDSPRDEIRFRIERATSDRSVRRFPRAPIGLPVTVDLRQGTSCRGIALSTSVAGMGLASVKPVTLNQELSVGFRILGDECVLKGRVVYAQRLDRRPFHSHVGMFFFEAPSSTIRELELLARETRIAGVSTVQTGCKHL